MGIHMLGIRNVSQLSKSSVLGFVEQTVFSTQLRQHDTRAGRTTSQLSRHCSRYTLDKLCVI